MRIALAIYLIFSAALPAAAQLGFSSGNSVLPMEEAFQLSVERTESGRLDVSFVIEEGYYLYREFLSATTPDGEAIAIASPDGIVKDDPSFGTTEIYYDAVRVSLVPDDLKHVDLSYQGCQEDGLCYPPTTRTIDVTSASVLAASDGETPLPNANSPATSFEIEANQGGMVSTILERGGVALVLLSFLGFGAVLAFTPCVFPMYPILAATLAREGGHLSMTRGFTLSLAYVLALASAFGLLGIAAAWSGQNLQIVLQSPLAIGIVSGIFILLAASMFGLFELQLPAALTNRIASKTGRGGGSIPQAAVLGFTSAMIIGPCVTAPLAGALLYIAQTADITLGASALFALGLGKGIPLIIMGTFGISALPRAGAWMEQAKHLFGFIFLGTAIFLISRIIPGSASLALWALLSITVGVFLGAFDAMTRKSTNLARASKAIGLAATIYGVLLAVGATTGSVDPARPLAGLTLAGQSGDSSTELKFSEGDTIPMVEASLRDASSGNRSSMIYFTADWCVTCKAIERDVLADPATIETLAGVNLIKADLSDIGDEAAKLMDAMSVVGPPTMIFFDDTSHEIGGTRLVGDVTLEALAASSAKSRGL